MAVFDADKDISPGIVVSVPFFGGILALLMIGGARISHFFFQSGLFSLCVSSVSYTHLTLPTKRIV